MPMLELAAHLRAQRADLVERMANALAADGDWHGWLGLLAQVQVALQAVEAVVEERTEPPRTHDTGTSHASENAPERP